METVWQWTFRFLILICHILQVYCLSPSLHKSAKRDSIMSLPKTHIFTGKILIKFKKFSRYFWLLLMVLLDLLVPLFIRAVFLIFRLRLGLHSKMTLNISWIFISTEIFASGSSVSASIVFIMKKQVDVFFIKFILN